MIYIALHFVSRFLLLLDSSSMSIITDLIDCSLLTAHFYLLLRLGISKHEAFQTSFFHWFVMSGLFSSISVIGYIIGVRFSYPSKFAWVFKYTYVLNSFTVTAATIGKLYMSLHRLAVMRSISLFENVWTKRLTTRLVIAQLFLSAVQCGQIFFCDYSFVEKNGVKYVSYFDDSCTVFEKSKSSVIYLIFVILSTILIVLISREMFRLSSMIEDKTKHLLLKRQKEMFIVVSVCSITHLVKALHQMCWVLVAAFHWQDFSAWLQDSYPYTHYLSTYSGAVTLVIFNSRVRWLLISIKCTDNEEGTTRVTSLSRF